MVMAERLTVGGRVTRQGFITRALVLRGKTADRLEAELGYGPGRLADGWWLLFLLQKPSAEQFEYAGYTHMSDGRFEGHLAAPADPRTAEQHLRDDGMDLAGLKRRTIENTFRVIGPERLAKVVPVREGSEYPAGLGQPQWRLVMPMEFAVAAFVGPGQIYQGLYT
jgi:hypothetical protein